MSIIRNRTLQLVAGVVALGAALLAWELLPVRDYLREVILLTRDLGWRGLLVYYGVYVVCSLVSVPRTPLNIGAGVLFDYPDAVAVVLASAATAQIVTFWIARSFARDWVERRVRRSARAREAFDLVQEQSFKLVFLVRVNPFIPGSLKGYGFGVTPVRFSTYLLASVLGALPIVLVHVYVGWISGVAVMWGEEESTPLQGWLLGGGLAVSLMLVGLVIWYSRRALAAASARTRTADSE